VSRKTEWGKKRQESRGDTVKKTKGEGARDARDQEVTKAHDEQRCAGGRRKASTPSIPYRAGPEKKNGVKVSGRTRNP